MDNNNMENQIKNLKVYNVEKEGKKRKFSLKKVKTIGLSILLAFGLCIGVKK